MTFEYQSRPLISSQHAASLAEFLAAPAAAELTFELAPLTAIPANPRMFRDLCHLPPEVPGSKRYAAIGYDAPAIHVRSLAGAIVHPRSGLVFDRDGNAIETTLAAQKYHDPSLAHVEPIFAQARQIAETVRDEGSQPPPSPPCLFTSHGGYTVFGHLMCETLPVALAFAGPLRAGAIRLLMPFSRHTALPDRLLGLIGLEPGVQFRSAQPFVRLRHLILSSTCDAKATFRNGPLQFAFIRTAIGDRPRRSGRRRLFFTRRNEITTQRRDLVNEDALIAALAPLGFETINAGQLSMQDQIDLFAQTECMIGLTGSIWGSAMFSGPDTLMVDLIPEHKANVPDTFGYRIATAFSRPYIAIVLPSTGPSAGNLSVTADVALIVDRVRRGLERVAAAGPTSPDRPASG